MKIIPCALCRPQIYKRIKKKQGDKCTYVENVILTSSFTWDMCSKWYTPDFHVVIIDI